jgi:hypothetical protein
MLEKSMLRLLSPEMKPKQPTMTMQTIQLVMVEKKMVEIIIVEEEEAEVVLEEAVEEALEEYVDIDLETKKEAKVANPRQEDLHLPLVEVEEEAEEAPEEEEEEVVEDLVEDKITMPTAHHLKPLCLWPTSHSLLMMLVSLQSSKT